MAPGDCWAAGSASNTLHDPLLWSIAEQEHSQSAIGPGNTEPRGDMVYQKQKLQHLQRQVISKESVSCPAVQHLETCTRGIGFTSLGLWHTMAGGCTLRPTFPNRNMPGHYLVN